ncbi:MULTISPECIES: hypothetical protein [Pseudomonas]|uniref:hypothetical protein n=1 Tax=Pseudomonas TaxID=286 RepID=UPI000D0025B3|nr:MULTISPECIES: hypothetical protein [Pseudomonas]PRA53211.1 hypothetical protein CQZ98_14360 [Pseudomonas sp. MYb115]QXN52185.1 hypothetical protein KW062_10795 [Pseudomonas fluorescens]WSO26514.1 hypothetical protein VUJ50_10855 [Pseudomonas fluorescens]
MSFFRAAQCFAAAQDALTPPLPYSNAEAVKHAFSECSEGLSGVPRSELDQQALEWVSQLDLLMDYSEIAVPQGKGGLPAKAELIGEADQKLLLQLVGDLQAWFSAANKKPI